MPRSEAVTADVGFEKAKEQREEEISMLDSIAKTAVTSAMKAFAEFYSPIATRRIYRSSDGRICTAEVAALEYQKRQGPP